MILFLVLVIIIWFASKKNEKIRFWKNKVIQQPFNYFILVGLLIVGFLFRLDYSDRFGCIILAEPVFEYRNILFSAISITCILLSFFCKSIKIKLIFISLELLLFSAKLFLIKGGYVVGYTGTADQLISLYDTTTLAIRFFIINSFLKTNVNQIYLILCTIIIMSIKTYIFPLPYSYYIDKREWQIITINTKNYLTKGEWIENKDITEKVRIVFFRENAVLYNFQDADTLFFNSITWLEKSVFLESWDWKNSKRISCVFEFKEIGKDTLSVNFRYNNEKYRDENYKTLMIRKIDNN